MTTPSLNEPKNVMYEVVSCFLHNGGPNIERKGIRGNGWILMNGEKRNKLLLSLLPAYSSVRTVKISQNSEYLVRTDSVSINNVQENSGPIKSSRTKCVVLYMTHNVQHTQEKLKTYLLLKIRVWNLINISYLRCLSPAVILMLL